jgi:hypothetical protein
MDQSTLSPREAAELRALEALVSRGKILPDTREWARYLELVDRSAGPVADPAPADGFRLEPGAAHVRGTAAYLHLYCEERSLAVERRLQRWRKLGAEQGIPAPLGNPEQMIVWYQQMREAGHLKHAVPEILIEAAARASAPPAQSAPAPAAAVADPMPPPPPPVLDAPEVDLSTRSVIARLQDDEARLHQRYLQAVATGESEAAQEVHRRRWSEASELLIMQRSRAEKMRELLDPAEVNSALVRFLPALAQSIVAGLVPHVPRDVAVEAVRSAFAASPDTIEHLLVA